MADVAHGHASLEPDVAVLAPCLAPAVLDEPVVLAVLPAVANHRHGVVPSLLLGNLTIKFYRIPISLQGVKTKEPAR